MKSAQYKFFTPSQLFFGEGCATDVGKWAIDLGGSKVLLVTDGGLAKTDMVDKVKKDILAEGLAVFVYDTVEENPTANNVNQGRDLILQEKIDVVVAIGGGSPMDAAKAMAVLSVHEGSIVEYEMGLKPLVKKGPPVIAIPTTAGTGSEATMGSVITDQSSHRKIDVVSPLMAPHMSLVDPLLTQSLPASLTGSTGMDALTHSVEGYTATLASPLTDAIHFKAIELLGASLLKAYQDGNDKSARSNVMMASMIAGIGFPNSGLGSVHGLSLPLGGHFNIPHGVANAIMLPYVMRFNIEACPQKFIDIAKALGATNVTPEGAVEAVIDLSKALQIPSLRSYKVEDKDLARLAKDALGRNSNCVTNPRTMNEKDAIDVYRKALEEE
jgi:alcohol dehydrogenase class IV